MSRHAAERSSTVEWRRFGRYLWAGSDDGLPIGTVERGRRYKAIDPEGTLLGRAPALEDAQALLVYVAESRAVVRNRVGGVPEAA